MICTACPLHEHALSNCLGGIGTGPLLVVGAYPGSREDMDGEPFVGPTSDLLRDMLADAGFKPSDYALTNAIRCAPRRDVSIEVAHIDACRNHLRDEIHARRPEAIVALGDVALRALTKMSGITAQRGKSFPLHADFGYACEVWPTLHAAYVAREGKHRPTVVADFRRVRDRGLPPDEIAWSAWPAHPHRGTIAWDIETDFDRKTRTGGDRVTSIAFASAAGVDVMQSDPLGAATAEFLCSAGATFSGHNSRRFDVVRMRAAGVAAPFGEDTMWLAWLLDESQPLGLEALSVKYLGARGWKEERDATEGSPEHARYNARDALWTLRLYEYLLGALGPRIRIDREILVPGHLALEACAQRGLWIDGAAVERARESHVTERDAALEALRMIVGSDDFNPGSTPQVGAALSARGLRLPRTKKKAQLATDKAALAPHRGDALVDALERWRKGAKLISTYDDHFAAIAASADGRVHPTYALVRSERDPGGTVSGRITASDNVLTLPRDLRHYYAAPPGRIYAEADYSALEFWIAAWVAGEEGILRRRREDAAWDPHRFFAARFYSKSEVEVTPLQRQVAKSANFSQLYLGDAHTLQNYAAKLGIILSLPQCFALHGAWHETFRFRPWYDRVAATLRAQGYIETATGRRRHFGDPRLLAAPGKFLEAHRAAVNMLVQSLATDIGLLALDACHRARLPIVHFFHDSISFEFESQGDFNSGIEVIQSCMTVEPVRVLRERFGVDLSVPLSIEVKAKNGDILATA